MTDGDRVLVLRSAPMDRLAAVMARRNGAVTILAQLQVVEEIRARWPGAELLLLPAGARFARGSVPDELRRLLRQRHFTRAVLLYAGAARAGYEAAEDFALSLLADQTTGVLPNGCEIRLTRTRWVREMLADVARDRRLRLDWQVAEAHATWRSLLRRGRRAVGKGDAAR